MILYMVGKLAPNSSHLTRGLVKYVPSRDYFRAVSSQNGKKFPPQSLNGSVQMTSSRVRLGQSFKTVGCGCTSCWGDLGAGSVEADVFYIPFIVSVQYIV